MRRLSVPSLKALASMALTSTVLALLAAGDLRAMVLPDRNIEWIRVETAHLTLFSNAPEDETIRIGLRMEQYRAVLARLGPDLTPDSPVPMSVFVFRDELTFLPYMVRRKGRFEGQPANIDGFFVQQQDGNYIGVNATPAASPWPVIYHEYFHFFLHNNVTDVPLWFDEGIAQCYSTFRLEGDHAEIGGPFDEKIEWMRRHPFMSLAKLQSITFDSPEYHEEDKQATFYAESWVLVQYLLWGPGRRTESGVRFLHDLKRGGSLAEALAPVTAAMDPALERRVADYFRKGSFGFSDVALDAPTFDRTTRVAAIPRDEVLYRLGDFLLHIDPGRARDAEEHLREAIRLNPRHAGAYAGLGRALADRKQYKEAQEAFEKAMTLDPASLATTLAYAYVLAEEVIPNGLFTVDLDAPMPPQIVRARELFQRAARAAPDLAEAWAGLGATYVYDSGDPAPGVEALEKAHRLLPGRDDIAYNLAELYSRGGRRDRVQELIDHVLSRSSDPAMRAAGPGILFRTDLAGIDALLSKGEVGAATARLKSLLVSAPTPAMRSVVEQHLRHLETLASRNQAAHLYNEAIDEAKARHYDAAADKLDRVLATTSDAEIVARAKDLQARVRDEQVADRQVATYNDAVQKFNHREFAAAVKILDRLLAEVKDPDLARKARTLRGSAKEALATQDPPAREGPPARQRL